MKTSLVLATLARVTSSFAFADDFDYSFNLVTDSSVASHSRQDDNSAHRILVTAEWQWQASDRWLLAGDLKAFRGENGEGLTQNLQGISNIDAEKFSKIYEAYAQYQFNPETRIKCGQVDANLEFAYVPVAETFISPPLGITPTVIALPTYYDPAMSCSIFYEPAQGLQWAGGIFAGRDNLDFAEQFYVFEGRYVSPTSRMSYGFWHHNGDWEWVDKSQFEAISGWYVNYQRQINQDWAMFAVWSALEDEVDDIRQHHMLGFVREFGRHQLGMMFSEVTQKHLHNDNLIELYWQHILPAEISLQPVLQWVDHAEEGVGNQFVLSLRVNWNF